MLQEDILCEEPGYMHREGNSSVAELDMGLERDVFLRTLLRHLAGTLEEVVGLKEAAGFVSVVGQRMGEEMNEGYKKALALPSLSREQVAGVLVDLKRRIQGDFFIIDQDNEKIVLGNRACPFGDKVSGRPSLCMMTSNVFGFITSENLGYAKVSLQETIALGHQGCRVVVYLKPSAAAQAAEGREYVRTHG
jgi:predicted ArsR family transcriptional regulator